MNPAVGQPLWCTALADNRDCAAPQRGIDKIVPIASLTFYGEKQAPTLHATGVVFYGGDFRRSVGTDFESCHTL